MTVVIVVALRLVGFVLGVVLGLALVYVSYPIIESLSLFYLESVVTRHELLADAELLAVDREFALSVGCIEIGPDVLARVAYTPGTVEILW